MALIVEDGTGLAAAESYISVTDADTYIASFKGANATWDVATVAAKEIAARQATQYLDGKYAWKGQKEYATQALDWPRAYAYDETGTEYSGVPVKLEQATAETMFLIVTGATITETVSRGTQVKREKVGEIEVEYMDGAAQQPEYPEVNRLLSDLTIAGGRSVRS